MVFVQFLDDLQEYLLNTVFCIILVLEIFHAHAKEQQSVPLQKYAEPFIVMVRIKSFKQLLVTNMVVFSAILADITKVGIVGL
jgi:hypothetical protein